MNSKALFNLNTGEMKYTRHKMKDPLPLYYLNALRVLNMGHKRSLV